MNSRSALDSPRHIRMHAADNVAIVANDGGLPAGTLMADGLRLVDKVPQGHKVALVDLARRPKALVRGSKRRWALVCFVQPVGPIAYLAFGRR